MSSIEVMKYVGVSSLETPYVLLFRDSRGVLEVDMSPRGRMQAIWVEEPHEIEPFDPVDAWKAIFYCE